MEPKIVDVRALIPMHRDPLEVEVDGRPQDVCHPSTIVLFRFAEPFSILYKDSSASWRPVCMVGVS